MENSVFDIQSIDRNRVKWEHYLLKPTPVQKIGDLWFKREDYFAPLGYGSINGSKLRQCIWIVNGWVKTKPLRGVISGSVAGSPQHPFIASICNHYGLGCLILTGTSDPLKHKNMELASKVGAKFHKVNIGYARALQSKAFQLKEKLPDHEVLETNITLDERLNPAGMIENFHRIGAHQVDNIPEHIETLVIPCGSCNSVVSVLYGIHLFKPKGLKRIVLVGIGNNGSFNLEYIPNRLRIIGKVLNEDVNATFNYCFSSSGSAGGIKVDHVNPNGEGFCGYEDWMPYQYGELELHPRYEGKCFNYFQAYKDKFSYIFQDTTLFWVVGSEPKFI